jgi:hypothetical protein
VLALGQHLLGQVHTDDLRAGPGGELDCHPGGAGGHIEDQLAGAGHDVVDHLLAPAAVLAEREQLGQAVIPGGERGEQSLREAIAAHDGGQRHGRLLGPVGEIQRYGTPRL